MSYVGPSEHLPDGTAIPPIRRITVRAPDANGISILCTALVLNSQQRLARIEITPSDGPYTVGDLVEYAYMPDEELPIVKNGRGQF